jgi:colicin import membrane protein
MSMTLATHSVSVITDSRKRVKQLRLKIENRRKELKEDSLRYGKAIDSRAKELANLIAPIEAHLEQQEEIHEAEKARQKAEKEAARRAVLNQRINVLTNVGAPVDVAAVEAMSDERFAELVAAETVKAQERQAQQEAERIERDRIESERQAEQQRQAAELRAERERIEIERAELRQQQERMESERLDREAKEARRIAEDNRLKAEAESRAKAERLKPILEQYDGFTSQLVSHLQMQADVAGNPTWSIILVASVQSAIQSCREKINS